MTIDYYPDDYPPDETQLDEITLDDLDVLFGRAPPRPPQPRSGTPFDPVRTAHTRFPAISSNYLRWIAPRESGGNPRARPIDPKTGALLSTAYGTYQFTNDTAADVPMDLLLENGWDGESDWRADPLLSAVAAAWLADDNRQYLARSGVADPTESNLFLAHWAGANRAAALLRANPSAIATTLFTDPKGLAAIRANRSVFYHEDDTPKTVGEVIRRFTVGEAPPHAPPQPPPPINGVGVTAQPLRTPPRGQTGVLPPPPRGGVRPPPQGNTPPRSGVGQVVADAIAAVTGEPPEGEGGMPLFGEPAPAPSVGFLKHPGKAPPFEGFQMQPPPQLPPLRLVRTPYGWITGRGIGDLDEEMT